MLKLKTVGLAINQLSLAYLSPHLYPRDERAKTIVSKSMFVNYFVIIIVIGILMFIFNTDVILKLNVYEVLNLLVTIYISSISLIMVYFSKKI